MGRGTRVGPHQARPAPRVPAAHRDGDPGHPQYRGDEVAARSLGNAPGTPARISLQLPPTDWFEAHTNDVRRRLHLLPGDGTYEFAIQLLLRQLGSACDRIARYAGSNREATGECVSSLFWRLHARAFRGVTLGVAALAWHCLGFDPGCPREKALGVLNHIREKGSARKANLLLAKGCRVNAKTRDILLDRLAAENLIRVEGATVTAASFGEFVAALHSRPALPEADSFDLLRREGDPRPENMAGRFGGALSRVFGARLNNHDSGTTVHEFDLDAAQLRWVGYLRSLEPRLPGISGTARRLLATLAFGLLELGRGGEVGRLPVSVGGVEALGQHLVERMAHAYESITRTAENERKNELIRRMFVVLAGGPMSKRDLYRRMSIDAALCEELLLEMDAGGLVQPAEHGWERIEGVTLPAYRPRKTSPPA